MVDVVMWVLGCSVFLFFLLYLIEREKRKQQIESLWRKTESLSETLSSQKGQIESLSKTLSWQGDVIQEFRLVLEKARLISYSPIPYCPEPKKPLKLAQGKDIQKEFPRPIFSVGSNVRVSPFLIRSVRNGSTIGYLTEDGAWTIDPKKIKTFSDRAVAVQHSLTMPASDGIKIEVYP